MPPLLYIFKMALSFVKRNPNIGFFYQGGGDMEECNYQNGVKHGKAVYYWKAGHKEEFLYDKGVKNGPAMLYGASGATRKGTLKNGKWHGEATYTTQVRYFDDR